MKHSPQSASQVWAFSKASAIHTSTLTIHLESLLLFEWTISLFFGKDLNSIDKVKKGLRAEFEMKDLGELQYFLGIQVKWNCSKRQLHINQSGYISSIFERFGMEDSKPASTPLATGTALHKAIEGDALMNFKPYQSLVGSQMYAMLCTRPDIAYAVSQISQHSSAPTATHHTTGKRGFRYLNANINNGNHL